MVATTQRANIPAISVVCDPSTDDVVGMACTLITQLVQILPNNFCSQADFSSARFGLLDKTVSTAGPANSLLKDLLTVAPQAFHMMIDGLQLLDTAANRSNPETLIGVLHQAYNRAEAGSPRIVRLLFTTDGFMDALAALNEDEKLDVIDLACEEGSGANADKVEMGFL